MIKVKGKTLPKIPVKGRVLDRVDGAVVADALGAELLSSVPSSYLAVHLKGLSSCLLLVSQPLQTRGFSDKFPITAS
jgi:hypothetical protein